MSNRLANQLSFKKLVRSKRLWMMYYVPLFFIIISARIFQHYQVVVKGEVVQESIKSLTMDNNYIQNPYKFSEKLSEYEGLGIISCSKFNILGSKTDYLDHSLKSSRCSKWYFMTGDIPVSLAFKSLNGDTWKLAYKIPNSYQGIAIWLSLGFFLLYVLIVQLYLLHISRLKLMNEKEKKALEARLTIANQVVHDLASPLSAIELLCSRDQFAVDDINILKLVTDRIRGISNELLELKNKPSTSRQDLFEVKKLLYEIKVEYDLKNYKNKSLKFRFMIDNIDPTLKARGNEIEVKRIMSNCLNNSIEAMTDSMGEISIECIESNSSFVEIKITDNGSGIPTEKLDQIFEKGFSLNKKYGSGLGLYHASSYMRKIGGKVVVKNNDDQGCQIMLCVPKVL